ncbi:MAG: hypothetical protein J0I31_12265 [Rhizobiales bacterium]|uniref:hypothetical protein n=1 Tax=Azorhizobium caulinodans TaxID=7 RepID=UPI001ACADFFE|nr:hypothetical protein [Hyphomicrobiales bacterium]
MKRFAIVCAAAFVSFTAQADTYPSTISDREKERHEFYHVQTENYPGGKIFSGEFESRVPSPAVTAAPHAAHHSEAHGHAGTRG